ncbi:MAG: tRNA preQ1(34) S-adenosylmethionine ribosyltransferase-isomerase QueA [Gemmatimonadota bacterium]|nr:tRNA preQ1(34) S-adenosylmethionine ribosyltransferase-isomerase QueA [Gemmatimonadota bacterium]
MPAFEGPLRTAEFEYELPAELIAQEPLADRAASRLLVVNRAGGTGADDTAADGTAADGTAADRAAARAFRDLVFSELPTLIEPGDLVVLNDTRVRHARLLGMRPSGAPAEVLLIHPAVDDTWVALGKPGSALREGKRIRLGNGAEIETVEVLADGHRRVRFVGIDAEAAIRRYGRLPLPPYIRHAPTADDEVRYQTVYAEREGSVAAPTAGLHFTPEVLAAIERRGARLARLTLEVGPGTFKPVEEADPARHLMHEERFVIPEVTARRVAATRASGNAVWAIGTTVVRALESAADASGAVRAGPGETRLMIVPGYRFRVVDRLVTNFHLPRSTLLMLVSAFAGRELIMRAYQHAVRERYRFYSYGDAMVIL